MISVEEILRLPSLKQLTIIAGESGLDRLVSTVTVTDVPDFFQWLKGNEFIMMTGFSFQNDNEKVVNLIKRLEKAKVSGLGIKFNRYLNRLPESAQKIADELKFPVLSIPYEYSWTDLINPIMTEIVNRQTRRLEYSTKVRRSLIEQLLGKGGLQNISNKLSELVNTPITIIDIDSGEAIYSRNTDKDILEFSNCWIPAANESISIVQKTPDIRYINSENYPRLMAPVEFSRRVNGYVLIWLKDRKYVQEDIIVLEQSIVAVALELEKIEAQNTIKRNYRHDFLRRILDEKIIDYSSAQLIAKELGWDLSKNYIVMVAHMEKVSGSYQKAKRKIWDTMEHLLRNIPRFIPTEVLYGLDNKRRLIFLFPFEGKGKNKETDIKNKANSLLKSINSTVNQFDNAYIVNMGIGNFYAGYEGIKSSYLEALRAVEIGPQLKGQGSVINFNQLGVYRLLSNKKLETDLKSFYNDTIGPLINYNDDKSDILIETLKVFLEEGSNYHNTARTLFIHQNTVRYRIKMIEDICNVDVKNFEDRLNLTIGLKLLSLIETNAPQ